MTKINFTKLPCYADIRKEAKIELNVKFQFANALYTSWHGIDAHALAMKIYNSEGELDYSDAECRIILDFAQKACSPILFDSLNDVMSADGASR